MSETTKTLFTIRQDDGVPFPAYHVLELAPGAKEPRPHLSWDTAAEATTNFLIDHPDAERKSAMDFTHELELRQTHDAEMLALLRVHGELAGKDITSYTVYASGRPWTSHFIAGTVGIPIQGGKRIQSWLCMSYVASPRALTAHEIRPFDLQFVSRPAKEE